MTIDVILKGVMDRNPTKRFATNPKKNAIAYWNESLGRWQILLGMLLNDEWSPIPELLVNGSPLIPQTDWVEVLK